MLQRTRHAKARFTTMTRRVAVFAFDANPGIDQPKGYISRAEREIRVARFGYQRLSDFAVQERAPTCETVRARNFTASGFDSVWHIRKSGGVISVCQMRTGKEGC